jgi:hypothetical protein
MSDEASWYKGIGKEFASHGHVEHRTKEPPSGWVPSRCKSEKSQRAMFA